MPGGVRNAIAALLLCAGVLGSFALVGGVVAPEVGVETEKGEPVVRVSEERIPGPAAGIANGGVGRTATAGLNRIGSTEVPVRVYEPEGETPWATLVWAHGGSFLRGTLDWPEADWAARSFAEAGLRVYSVDYALASDAVKAPAPANDVAAVLREVIVRHGHPASGAASTEADQTSGFVFVGGASAGAHLAALAALQQAEVAVAVPAAETASGSTGDVRGEPRAADALIMLYPTAHRVQQVDAALAAANAALPDARRFSAERIAEMYDFYLGADPGIEPRAASVAPAAASPAGVGAGAGVGGDPLGYPTAPTVLGELPGHRLALLPPTVIVNADLDDLRASGEQFAQQLREAGIPVVDAVQAGTTHGYMNRPGESARATSDARATIDRFVAELRRLGR